MKYITMLSALMLLLISSNVFSFSPDNRNPYSTLIEVQESSSVEEAAYLNYDINLSVQFYLQKVQFFPSTRENNFFNSTKTQKEEEYFCISHLIDPGLSVQEIIYPFHSFL